MSSQSSSMTPASSAWRTVEAPPDVDALGAGSFAGLGVGGVEAIGDEVKRRPALHLDRRVRVMGEHEHGSVVGRLGPPPARPLLVPLAADRAKHVAAHDVGAAGAQQTALGIGVSLIRALVAEVPVVQLTAPFAERVLAALIRPGDEAVEGDRHVAGGVGHYAPSK